MAEYSIRQLTEMFQLPASTLRYYEDIGLLTNVAKSTSNQRIYTDGHVNRLKTICCFKNTGMTIAQLQAFFSYESQEADHIDDILLLLNTQKESIVQQIDQLRSDYAHILRKLHYYGDIKQNLDAGQPLPQWKDYKFKSYSDET